MVVEDGDVGILGQDIRIDTDRFLFESTENVTLIAGPISIVISEQLPFTRVLNSPREFNLEVL